MPIMYLACPWWLLVTAALFLALSDLLDGFFAKRWKCESEYGRKLDIWADKISCLTMAGIVWHMSGFHYETGVVFSLFIVYEGLNWLLYRSQVIARPCWAGKCKVGLLFVAMPIFLIGRVEYGLPLTWVSFGFGLWSLAHYTLGASDIPVAQIIRAMETAFGRLSRTVREIWNGKRPDAL